MTTEEKRQLQALLDDLLRMQSDSARLALLHQGKPVVETKYLAQVLAFEMAINRIRSFQHNCK